jgi:hypothetical protein
VVAVGGPEIGLDVQAVGRAGRAELGHEIPERLLADHRVDDLPHDPVRVLDRRLGDPVEEG